MSNPQPPEGAVEPLAVKRYAEHVVAMEYHPRPKWEDEGEPHRNTWREIARADLQAAYPAILKDLEERLLWLDWREINAAAETICPSREHQPLACAQCVVQAALDSLEAIDA